MRKTTLKSCLIVGLFVAIFAMSTSTASAWWGHHWRYGHFCAGPCAVTACLDSPCYSACYTPCYRPYRACYTACDPCYAGCSWTTYRSCWPKWRCGCGLSCCGTCNVTVCSPCTSCGTVTGGCVDCEADIEEDVEVDIEAAPTPAAGTPNSPTTYRLPADAGVLTLIVPEDAVVRINGRETDTPGAVRQYVSYGLQAGYAYDYEVHVSTVRNGKLQEETRQVTLTAGGEQKVAFSETIEPVTIALIQ